MWIIVTPPLLRLEICRSRPMTQPSILLLPWAGLLTLSSSNFTTLLFRRPKSRILSCFQHGQQLMRPQGEYTWTHQGSLFRILTLRRADIKSKLGIPKKAYTSACFPPPVDLEASSGLRTSNVIIRMYTRPTSKITEFPAITQNVAGVLSLLPEKIMLATTIVIIIKRISELQNPRRTWIGNSF